MISLVVQRNTSIWRSSLTIAAKPRQRKEHSILYVFYIGPFLIEEKETKNFALRDPQGNEIGFFTRKPALPSTMKAGSKKSLLVSSQRSLLPFDRSASQSSQHSATFSGNIDAQSIFQPSCDSRL
jgi:hypothetical protein